MLDTSKELVAGYMKGICEERDPNYLVGPILTIDRRTALSNDSPVSQSVDLVPRSRIQAVHLVSSSLGGSDGPHSPGYSARKL
jgi:hypothetical protein